MRKWVVVVVMAAVVAALAAVTTAQEGEKKDKLLDECDGLSLKGELTKQGDRPAFKVTDGEHKGKTFILLENAKLEDLEKWIKESKPEAVEVSCTVTKYNGKNFLAVSSFTKPGEDDEEEDEEEEGDNEEEGEEEKDE
jgi:hypothetical protein